MKLKFKKEGWFSEAVSARYKANVSKCIYVTIEAFKTPDYGLSWCIRFDSDNVETSVMLNRNLNRYIDPVSTKRYAIETIEFIIKNNNVLKNIIDQCTTN